MLHLEKAAGRRIGHQPATFAILEYDIIRNRLDQFPPRFLQIQGPFHLPLHRLLLGQFEIVDIQTFADVAGEVARAGVKRPPVIPDPAVLAVMAAQAVFQHKSLPPGEAFQVGLHA